MEQPTYMYLFLPACRLSVPFSYMKTTFNAPSLRPYVVLRPQISFYSFFIFEILQVGGRTLNDPQIQRFKARNLILNILSSLHKYNWLCIKELTNTVYFEFFIGSVPPPTWVLVLKKKGLGLIGLISN
jgi:hypothetical protein